MNLRLPLKITAVALALSFGATEAIAQGCTNTTLYPSNTIVPNSMGGITEISSCNYLQEYSAVGPVIPNGNYEFTTTGNGYITVREGTPTGPVIAEGTSPVTATATMAGNLYAHWNTDASCGTGTGCQTTTVQFMLDCTPPMASVTATDDCPNNEFSLNVNVTSLGDGTDVDLIYNVNGGADQTLADQQVGSVTIGPFTVGEIVNLTVAHSSDPLCNLILTGLQSGNTCPTIIQCGGAPLDQTYCYGNNDNNHWHYQSSTGEALIMIFSAGTIESSAFDHIRIYNGPNNLSPLLYENPTGLTQLGGVQVIAPSGEIYMENSSESSGSCQTSSSYDPWVWQVGCLDCTGAAATFTVVTDCDNFNFSVDVTITDIGSGADATITNNGGADPVTVTAPGVYTVGPFTANIPVIVTVENPDNILCNTSSNALLNPLCPTPVVCGGPPLDDTYCYGNNDNHSWHWQSSTGDALIMIFSAGTIESSTWDQLRIYNGPDNLSPLLYMNPTGLTQFGGLQVIAPSGHIYMEMSSETSGSCQSSTNYAPWVWQVGCLDCSGASATYTVVTDCDNYEFSVDVDITDIGSGADATITNSGGVDPVTVTAPGVYTVGPFTANTPVIITVVNPDNVLCNTSSNALVNPLCPTPVVCGGPPLDETYCYINNDSHTWHWQSSTGDGLIMIFSAGAIESNTWDQIRIYDGPDNQSPLLYQNPSGTTQLAGLQVIAPSGHIYMENGSDGSNSCQSGTYAQWVWQVGCLDCSGASATYTVVTDCDHFEFSVDVDITDIGSGADATITNNGGVDPVTVTAPGVYTVGPFTAGIPVIVTVENPDNVLCNTSSNALVNPLCPTTVVCGGPTLEGTYCYINNDSHTWHWQSSTGQPLAMLFSAGSIESSTWDHIRIYDGPDNLSPLLYQNASGTTQLAGLELIAGSGHIYMENSSDGSGSCQSGGFAQWEWEIGCLDCTNPGATFSIVTDCIHHAYAIAVNVDSLGSGAFVRIANSLSTDTLSNVSTGITMVGPFPMDSTVVLTVLNEANNLCRIYSQELTFESTMCVDTSCAATAYEYCYSNLDTAWFAYQGEVGLPLTIEFLWGQLLADDFVQIFDGWVPTPGFLIWQGNLNGNLTGWAVNTTENNHKMLMRVVSNGSHSCATGEAFPPLHWVVQCGSVGIDENLGTSFSMYPNPTTGELSLKLPSTAHGSVDMRVVDLSGRTVHQEIFNSTGGVNTFDLAKLQSGNYVVTITTNDWVKSQQLQIIH